MRWGRRRGVGERGRGAIMVQLENQKSSLIFFELVQIYEKKKAFEGALGRHSVNGEEGRRGKFNQQ